MGCLNRLFAMGILNTLTGNVVPFLLGLFGLSIVRTIVTYSKLRQFGGPRWTGWTGWPHSRAMLRGNCHKWYAEVNEKYGMRYYLNLVSLPMSYHARTSNTF